VELLAPICESSKERGKIMKQVMFDNKTLCMVDHRGGSCNCSYSYDENAKPMDIEEALDILYGNPKIGVSSKDKVVK
jgi:hypothetical protein